jgi:hypothetical protein
MVGQWPLEPLIQVRILAPQQNYQKGDKLQTIRCDYLFKSAFVKLLPCGSNSTKLLDLFFIIRQKYKNYGLPNN